MTDLSIKLCSWQRKCPGCTIAGMSLGCSKCNGTGLIYVLDASVRVPCSGPLGRCIPVLPEFIDSPTMGVCHNCGGRGWTPSTDFETWYKAAVDSLHVVIVIQNDGPGYRCDIRPNDSRRTDTFATGWSTGWPGGGLELEGFPTQELSLKEALQSALAQMMEAQDAQAL